MKKLALILVLTLVSKLSLLAGCHGAAVLVAHKVDEQTASMHIEAVMQCDDESVLKFQSRECQFTNSNSKDEIAALILAMAKETVGYFTAMGLDNNEDDLMAHLKFRVDDNTL